MFLTEKYVQLFSKPKSEGGLGYKDSSIATVSRNLAKIFFDAFVVTGQWPPYEATLQGKKLFNSEARIVPEKLGRTDDVMKAVLAVPEKQRSQYLYPLFIIYNSLPNKDESVAQFYKSEYEKANKEHKELITLAAPNTSELANTLTDTQYDNVLDKYNQLADRDSATPAILIRRLILALYKYIKPLRPQDYVNTSYLKDRTPNYIDLQKKVLVIKSGKTNSEENTRIVSIPDVLIKIMRYTQTKLGTTWLIPMVSDVARSMERTAFTKFFQNIFANEGLPKHIGATRLRNMAVAKEVDRGASATEIKKSAADMGHSVGTHLLVYPKESERLHGPKPTEPTPRIGGSNDYQHVKTIQALRKLLVEKDKLIQLLLSEKYPDS